MIISAQESDILFATHDIPFYIPFQERKQEALAFSFDLVEV